MRVFMVVHNYYPRDIRVRREAEAMARAGHEVEVFCLREVGEVASELIGGVRVHRLPVRRHREGGLAVYLFEYVSFALFAGMRLLGRTFHQPPAILHAHNPPDVLLWLGLPARWLRRTRLVLDVHDISSHLFGSRFGRARRSWKEAWIERIETACWRRADFVITVHDDYRRLIEERGVRPERIFVAMNLPDDRLFDPTAWGGHAPPADRFVLVYHGLLAERGGVDLLLHATARLRSEIPNLELRLAGWGPLEKELRALSERLGLDGSVRFLGKLSWEEIPALLAQAHLACVPNRPDPLNRYALNNKILECIAMGLPVVSSRSDALLRYFGPEQIAFVEPGDLEELVDRIRELASDPRRRADQALQASRFHQTHRWSEESLRLVAALEKVGVHGRKDRAD